MESVSTVWPLTNATVKVVPLLALPVTVTTTSPVVVPGGTGTTILMSLQLVGYATVPLNVTVLVPWVDPKSSPEIVTKVPILPVAGAMVVMLGGGTVKFTPLLAAPFFCRSGNYFRLPSTRQCSI